mmetsp:Transcript_100206/g.292216  ORF Transcript_100206/g.292216 Transcript_100206/m.292216 type:complete len:284 (-) Transcript_100206:509-1360(-)
MCHTAQIHLHAPNVASSESHCKHPSVHCRLLHCTLSRSDHPALPRSSQGRQRRLERKGLTPHFSHNAGLHGPWHSGSVHHHRLPSSTCCLEASSPAMETTRGGGPRHTSRALLQHRSLWQIRNGKCPLQPALPPAASTPAHCQPSEPSTMVRSSPPHIGKCLLGTRLCQCPHNLQKLRMACPLQTPVSKARPLWEAYILLCGSQSSLRWESPGESTLYDELPCAGKHGCNRCCSPQGIAGTILPATAGLDSSCMPDRCNQCNNRSGHVRNPAIPSSWTCPHSG